MNRITVLLADDHTIVRQGLRKLLEIESDIEVIGEAKNGREAVSLAKTLSPDVVLLDIAMPLLNGLEALRQIHKAVPASKVLILSAHRDDAYIDQVMALGGSGYLIKQTSAQMLSMAIRKVKEGLTFVSPEVEKRLRAMNQTVINKKGRIKKKQCRLSEREAEVLQLVAEGKANKQIAAELSISIKTVEKHRQHLMEKLNIHDTAGLTRYAVETGAIESGARPPIR
ncbi:MAG: response regulator transcription factor [Candidatus Omnitrophica bacterium]|nr:response regulator transcription factor [Candidatus Omnitrophota bacterium]